MMIPRRLDILKSFTSLGIQIAEPEKGEGSGDD
jgi:hypothetical protein